MCGIFAYINHKAPKERKVILATLINGLKRLEYRGYDSAGLACDNDDMKTITVKRSGKVANLENAVAGSTLDLGKVFDCHVGIAHTRWATHGPPNEVNCHPHQSNAAKEFTVVHNGIITNSNSLRALLERKGYTFVSDTDTESIAVLCQYIFDEKSKDDGAKPDFTTVVEEVISQLEGSFALVFKSSHYPGIAIATRRGSPLLIGIRSDRGDKDQLKHVKVEKTDSSDEGRSLAASASALTTKLEFEDGALERVHSIHNLTEEPMEFFLASDASAIIEHTKRILFLQDDDVACISAGDLSISRGTNRPKLPPTREIKTVELELHAIMKGSFEHFMLKEIYEQPESTFSTMRGRLRMDPEAKGTGTVTLGGLKDHIGTMLRCRRLLFIACGTSYNSAIAARQWLEETTQLPVVVDIASDFLDRECPIFRDDVCFFISQSGETADTLGALRYCKERGALVVGITNTVGSSISRESECGVHVNAGPEIGVASTKAYTSQVLVLILFGLMMCEDRLCMQERRAEVIRALGELPDKIRACLELDAQCKELAVQFKNKENLLIMGRGYNFANCLEGSLKIKELAYIHTEGILAGELKHGPLALIDEHMPIIMLILGDSSRTKSLNALEQVVARKGAPLVIYSEGDDVPTVAGNKLQALAVPNTVDCLQSIMSVIPLQLLSYHMACAKGYDVDCPRNLAKSVTVE
eukprot:m.91808 g.91808  ORF g.91808 m.91808 type:complete len:698 (-) comp20205_c0_seq1:700-2793(-)